MSFEAMFESEDATRFLKKLVENAKGFKQAKAEIVGAFSAVVFKDVIEHFEKEEGQDGKWKDWSESYARAMQKRGKGGNKILQDTGRLRTTFKPSSFRKQSEGILWFNNAKTKDGKPYAQDHDEGAGRIPQRQFMWLSNRAMQKLEEITITYMLRV